MYTESYIVDRDMSLRPIFHFLTYYSMHILNSIFQLCDFRFLDFSTV